MVDGMTVAKITISLPREALEKAQRAIRLGRAKSISAYVASAVKQKVEADDLVRMLDEMLEETGGPPTAEEERRMDRILGVRPRRAGKRR